MPTWGAPLNQGHNAERNECSFQWAWKALIVAFNDHLTLRLVVCVLNLNNLVLADLSYCVVSLFVLLW